MLNEFTPHSNWYKAIVQSPSITFSHTKYPSIKEKMKQMINDREEALAAHKLARTRIANRKQSNFIPFEKNQKVWLDTRNLRMNHHKKIAPKQEGPFEIKEVLGPVTCQLKLPMTWKIHNMFHATLLWPYIKNKIYGNNYPRPLPELLEGEVYEVETILKHQWRGRGYKYYVKWKGYPITEVAWKSKSAFSDDRNMLQMYKDWYLLGSPARCTSYCNYLYQWINLGSPASFCKSDHSCPYKHHMDDSN